MYMYIDLKMYIANLVHEYKSISCTCNSALKYFVYIQEEKTNYNFYNLFVLQLVTFFIFIATFTSKTGF